MAFVVFVIFMLVALAAPHENNAEITRNEKIIIYFLISNPPYQYDINSSVKTHNI